jgi:hypothetical protein
MAPGGPAVPLDKPLQLSASSPDAASDVSFDISSGIGSGSQLTLPVRSLTLRAKTGSSPSLEALEMPLGDVDIPASVLPPAGLSLRALSLGIPTAVAADIVHQQADALELHVRSPLRLTWSLVASDGSIRPLGPVPTEPLDIDIQTSLGSDGTPATTVTARCAGECWSIKAIADMRDGAVYIESPAELSPL